MIRPPAIAGAAFTHAADGDMRRDRRSRAAISEKLKISDQWATVKQTHGKRVVEASGPGDLGEADAVFTSVPNLPLAVFTADCAGVMLIGDGAVGLAHAGWRGASLGIVSELSKAMSEAGHPPSRAAIGPSIGPCCFEVGEEVAAKFPGFVDSTTWGTTSVDLWRALAVQLTGLDVWLAGYCTRHQPGWFSHRRDATEERMAAVVWIK